VSLHANGTPASEYFRFAARRKWYVIGAFALAIAAAVAVSSLQSKRYEATAQVLLDQQNAITAGDGIDATYGDPNRAAQTEVRIARVPELVRRVLDETGARQSPRAFLERSSVVAESDADVLDFRVRAASAEAATTLATAYAEAFTTYRQDLVRGALTRTAKAIEARRAELRKEGLRASAGYARLGTQLAQVRARTTVVSPEAVLLRSADDATQVRPLLARNVVLAGILGLVLGGLAAGLAEALDTRVRSTGEISVALEAPALGRVPTGAGRRKGLAQLPVLSAPTSVKAEAFRILRANLELRLREADAQAVLVSSALAGEGKSTVLANLALAFAQIGRSVVAVDLDLRRPVLGPLVGASATVGVADVLAGTATLEHALFPVPLRLEAEAADSPPGGQLLVLTAGTPPADPGDLVARPMVGELLAELRRRADLVLVDAPPLLEAADAISLSDEADGVLLVVRPRVASTAALADAAEILRRTRATKLGFVVAGVGRNELPLRYSTVTPSPTLAA
jgi:capsular exopolysaccharide synthesis family protein